MLLDALPQDLINFLTLKDVTVVGILLALLYWGYKHFSTLIEKLEERIEEKEREVREIRERYDDELKELRKEQSTIIEKISTLIAENTKVLQEVSLELNMKRRRHGKEEI